jgi:hypothetical protein
MAAMLPFLMPNLASAFASLFDLSFTWPKVYLFPSNATQSLSGQIALDMLRKSKVFIPFSPFLVYFRCDFSLSLSKTFGIASVPWPGLSWLPGGLFALPPRHLNQ